ncbi:Crp/Fnr family transcriptional regulator [Roseivirga echinicomitans]|uniref:Cyclic nucleotide-binding protein n=1 Tax=Roseivirga echinicomitans TaxID=296218 RepID=A0A150WYM1_9BACT|nr:Crp/Fnr family transcriptional regulator [Roseivirga echinicomitans]KYG71564.1 cyclic nucleotide-binding protein [Roseivirga echinicomitans]
MHIEQIIDNIYPIHPVSKAKLLDLFTEVRLPKQSIVLKANRVESKLLFIKKGIVRAFVAQPEGEVTFWFGKEGDVVLSMKSYVKGLPAYESIELLEDSQLYEIQSERLQKLFDQDVHIANWGRKLAEQELIKTEERLISRQFKTASERYMELLNQNPDLLQRVLLKHIASYLGITQVSLSRIRSSIR